MTEDMKRRFALGKEVSWDGREEGRRRCCGLPLWSIAHRNDELHANEQNTGVVENIEDVGPDVVSERVDGRISKRASDEEEGQIEVGLVCCVSRDSIPRHCRVTYQGEKCEKQANELIHEFNVQKNLAANSMICLPDLLPV